ncbi:MAG TPA: hypothetical protein VJH95_03060, partial [Candidatus Nanoarchaeia archaeon]|nr:hypothetical protein [Candidatus Nanoarchaeia archaeon]
MLASLKKLEASEAFHQWKSAHKDYYLSSCFTILEDKNTPPAWQFHYYSKKADAIVTFEVKTKITIEPASKVFKKKDAIVEPLEIAKVKIEAGQALKKVTSLKSYKACSFTQKLLLLQQINQPIWNLSLITSTYQILNIKLSAVSGEVLSESFESLLSLR